VRAMPNTPALIGMGVTGLAALPGTSEADRDTATRVLGAVGPTVWVDDESMLDAVTAVPEADRARVRNHIAHLQIINPEDLPRFAELGVTANLQALWACLDAQMLTLTMPLMGEERAGWQYQFASLERAGAALACGSDWPVSTPDPWQAMHVAVTRREPGVTEFDPLLPDEALSLSSILTAYTRGSHELLGMPGGRIAVGEVCDVAVADRDPFAADAAEIHLTRNRVTVLAGEVVYEAE